MFDQCKVEKEGEMQALQEKCETMKAELDEHRDIPYSVSQQSHLATGTYGHTGHLQAAGSSTNKEMNMRGSNKEWITFAQ